MQLGFTTDPFYVDKFVGDKEKVHDLFGTGFQPKTPLVGLVYRKRKIKMAVVDGRSKIDDFLVWISLYILHEDGVVCNVGQCAAHRKIALCRGP